VLSKPFGIMGVAYGAIIGAALHLPGVVRALRRGLRDRIGAQRAANRFEPAGPPIEQLAFDLRRLLHQHDAVRCSIDAAMRARRLQAIEWAISDCAVQAARALDVPCPDRPGPVPLEKPQLRRVLRALAAAGLVLPMRAGLLQTDKRH
jgi:hypothetical protein